MTVVGEFKDNDLCVILYRQDIDIIAHALLDFYSIEKDKNIKESIVDILDGLGV